MKPTTFPQANCVFGPPTDFTADQGVPIYAFQTQFAGGSFDGAPVVVTAWMPAADELAQLNSGAPVFLTFIGGLPPHMATTSFERAVLPALPA